MTEIRSNCLIALGGNLDFDGTSSLRTLQSCLAKFSGQLLKIVKISRFYHTPCFPPGAGPDYVNACVKVSTQLSPAEVLAALHRIEALYQRQRDQRWGMRTLDLDLVAFETGGEGLVLPDVARYQAWADLPLAAQVQAAPEELILPHPRLQDRSFVLAPLADIAAEWRHPVRGETVAEMLAARPLSEVAEAIPL